MFAHLAYAKKDDNDVSTFSLWGKKNENKMFPHLAYEEKRCE